MRSSLRLGSIAGIDIKIHSTFVFLLGWLLLISLGSGGGAASVLGGALFPALIFGIIVLHELGHALAARWFGIETSDITLWPMGGIARLERMPRDPRQEMIIAIAGPAVNVALAFALWIGSAFVELFIAPHAPGFAEAGLLNRLIIINAALAVFNLLPAFPMDGGRIFRAFVAGRRGLIEGTRMATRLGRMMAALFGLAGLFAFNPILVIIGVFVWIAAGQELAMVLAAQRRRGASAQYGYSRDGGIESRAERYHAEPGEIIEDAVYSESAAGGGVSSPRAFFNRLKELWRPRSPENRLHSGANAGYRISRRRGPHGDITVVIHTR